MLYARMAMHATDLACAFVAAQNYTTAGGNQVVSLAGAQTGDFAIIFGVNEAAMTGLSGWTHLTQQTWGTGDTTDIWCKALSASDISTGSVTVGTTSSGGLIGLLVYRGPTGAAIKATASGSATTLAVGGYTKSALARAIVTIGAGQVASGGSITVPTGTTSRVATFGSSTASMALADILPSTSYNNGALTWTGMPANPNGAEILELT